jgi:hypothetical protein
MPWLGLLAKLSPERAAPILREGQCKPVSDYEYVNLLRDPLFKGPALAF